METTHVFSSGNPVAMGSPYGSLSWNMPLGSPLSPRIRHGTKAVPATALGQDTTEAWQMEIFSSLVIVDGSTMANLEWVGFHFIVGHQWECLLSVFVFFVARYLE
jgi:hypothetical protein